MRHLLALISGTLFGLGLAVAQMVDPNKVLNFLDITGNWDPSLALVMGGALAITIPTFRWVRCREKPLLDSCFHNASKTALDKPLLTGAACFGIGWGMSGFCPGPAFASMAMGNLEAVIMVASIFVGFLAAGLLTNRG